MSDRLATSQAWNRARALKLHEHFQTVALLVVCWHPFELRRGAKLKHELARVSRLLHHRELTFSDPGAPEGKGTFLMEASVKTLDKEFRYWRNGGREDQEREEHVRRPEALLCAYKAGCGGHRRMPRELVQEFQRRCTLPTGGRDKHGKSPVSVAWDSIRRDYELQRPLPGIDYEGVPLGAEIPWHIRTAYRKKPARTLRALGNRGASAHKNVGAYVNLDYAKLRKSELFTLDDVRLDIVCIDEATGQAIEVVIYVLMEVASRIIVAYVMKPAAAIQAEDVDELLAHGLQTPGFGMGVGYVTHILFEKGTVACSDGAKAVLEGVTHGRLKTHQTGIVGGVRWIGGPRDKARGNAAGKAVIESFNRWLHFALLHLPGQRGNLHENQPQSLGDLGQTRFTDRNSQRQMKHTLIDRAEQLAQWDIASGGRLKLKLPTLYLFQLNEAVRDAIKRHNTEPGHEYRGHGTHFQAEVAPGLWESTDISKAVVAELADAPDTGTATDGVDLPEKAALGVQISPTAPAKRQYFLNDGEAARSQNPSMTVGQREVGIYWAAWSKLAKVRPDLDRHALTRRVLGVNVSHKRLTRPQWAQLLTAFRSIAHEARTAR